jgi:hypothetical protein
MLSFRVARWYFQTENPNLGKFWRVLRWKMLEYYMVIWSILKPFDVCMLWTFGTFCCNLVHIKPRFGILYRKKSGNFAFASLTFLATDVCTSRMQAFFNYFL